MTDHLHIVRDWLEPKNISHQYLDGSTSVKEKNGLMRFKLERETSS